MNYQMGDNNFHTSLSKFDGSSFDKEAGAVKQICWYFINRMLLQATWMPIMSLKIFFLRLFGAKIGHGLIIKPSVNIKFPWKLIIGNDVWIGENAWIDNLDHVTIGNNVCLSQGAMLLTGNHDYTISSFDYRNSPIIIENGVWIGSKSTVCSGVVCKSHSILTVGSVATKSMAEFTIYQGNPAVAVRKRVIK